MNTIHRFHMRRAAFAFLVFAVMPAGASRADIFQWEYNLADPSQGKQQSATLCPDGAGAVAEPDAGLSNRNLTMAYLFRADLGHAFLISATLSDAYLSQANLTNAYIYYSTLTNADLSQANLTNAYVYYSRLTNADLTDAVVVGASFAGTTLRGFTKEQLYSTASYKNHDLSGIGLGGNNLTGWSFAGQNLTNAFFNTSTLTSADLSQANLTNAQFGSATLTNADLSQANLTNAYFNDSTLTNADLSQANLTNAYFYSSTLTDADLTDAVVGGASFEGATSSGFTKEQLYSTASYKDHDLSGIQLAYNDLTGWNFAGQNLTNATFYHSTLTNADLSQANLTNMNFYGSTLTNADLSQANLTNVNFYGSTLTDAELTDAVVGGASFEGATLGGFTKEQLYSTASYKNHDLSGIGLGGNNLTGWNFVGQNLANAYFYGSTLTGADLRQANLTNAYFYDSTLTDADLTDAVVGGASFEGATLRGLTREQLYSTASYKDHDLSGIGLGANDLTGWNFAGQNLANAIFYYSTLTDADLTDAVVGGASFQYTTSSGFTKEQLYSTASYQDHDLSGIGLYGNDLTGWNFAGQNLTNALFVGWWWGSSTLADADFRGADTRGAYLEWSTAIVGNTILPDGHIQGLELAGGQTLVVRDYDGNSVLNPEDPPMPIYVEDHLVMGPGGILQMLFESDAWDSTISFEPGIPVTLTGGTLDLQLAAGVVPTSQIGRTFNLFDWTGVAPIGEFNIVSPCVWDASRLYTAGEITFVRVPEASSLALVALGVSHLLLRRRR